MKLTRHLLEILKLPRQAPMKKKTNKADPRIFDALCESHGLPKPEREFKFHPERKWRFDYLFHGWLALEVEGGAWTAGRHTRGAGFLSDIEKYNEAHILGYLVMRCTPAMIESGEACAIVARAIKRRGI